MSSLWSAPPSAPPPPTGTAVHLWFARLDLPRPAVLALRQCMSEDEHRRADRFRFEADRSRFIAARGTLRTILGRYLGVAARDVRFEYGARGKPGLVQAPGSACLSFNVSHAEGLALYGFTLARNIGVDLEYLRPVSGLQHVAERYFSAAEARNLAALPLEQQVAAFYNCWTRKEAYVKARGDGLSLALDSFDVAFEPSQRAKFLRFAHARDLGRWTLHALSPDEGYVAALVVEGPAAPISYWRYAPSPN